MDINNTNSIPPATVTNSTRLFNKRYWYFGGIIAVIVVTIGLLLKLGIFQFVGNYSVDRTYGILATKDRQVIKKVLEGFQLPWQSLYAIQFPFGGDTPPITEAAKAFAAGVWQGQQALLGHTSITLPELIQPPTTASSWRATSWQNDFELGRWILALWVATHLKQEEIPQAFWQKQEQVLTDLYAKFQALAGTNDSEAKDMLVTIEPLQGLLKQLATQERATLAAQLQDEVRFLMDSLSP
jgi:hypothetical protein